MKPLDPLAQAVLDAHHAVETAQALVRPEGNKFFREISELASAWEKFSPLGRRPKGEELARRESDVQCPKGFLAKTPLTAKRSGVQEKRAGPQGPTSISAHRRCQRLFVFYVSRGGRCRRPFPRELAPVTLSPELCNSTDKRLGLHSSALGACNSTHPAITPALSINFILWHLASRMLSATNSKCK